MKAQDYVQVDTKNRVVVVRINGKIFPLDLIYSAAYSVLDRAYVILDGDPNKEIYAILKPRNFRGKLEELGHIFYNELLNAAFFTVQLVRNRELREALVRATIPVEEQEFEDIATIWEEKFGGEDEGSSEERK